MRAVVQRVSSASVTVEGHTIARIGAGMLVLLGVKTDDTDDDADRLARKLKALRIFEGADGRMNLSVQDVGGEILCVSNFTVYGDARKGNRPSFVQAAAPEEAERLYEHVREELRAKGGRFGAHMAVELVNDGPVTVILDT
jgi:D-tyrosyl-tRNA(Tyr) deacylase